MKNWMFLFLGLIVLSSVASATSITVNSLVQKDRDGNLIGSAQNVADQIFIDITVTSPNVYQNLRYPYVKWSQPNNPNAWVGCNAVTLIDSQNWNWLCILTVTPQMNQTSNVYLETNTHNGDNAEVLLGTWDFNAKPFPQNPNCVYVDKCRRYYRYCITVCRSFSRRTGECTRYREVCVRTDVCELYTRVKRCSNRPII